LLAALSFALAIPPSLLQFSLELRILLVEAMEGECSPILDIMGDASKVPLPEASMARSSSDASSGWGGAASDEAEVEAEDTVDPCEFAQSYDFGASLVTVGHIRQVESLLYFAEGSTCELGEETVPELNDDEAIVFEKFFMVALRMRPHLALTEIFLKYWVQLHQLTPNVITQLFKYFWAVLSFG
jgi:hypothetical protein